MLTWINARSYQTSWLHTKQITYLKCRSNPQLDYTQHRSSFSDHLRLVSVLKTFTRREAHLLALHFFVVGDQHFVFIDAENLQKQLQVTFFHLCVQDKKSCLYPHDKICIWPTYINTNWEMNYARKDCDRKMLTPHKLNILASSVHLCIWDIYYFVNQIKNCNKCSGHNWPRIRVMHSIGLYKKLLKRCTLG